MPRVGENKLHLLDMKPDLVVHKDGVARFRKDLLHWGSVRCFVQRDLYTTFFGEKYSTEIEEKFFGPYDKKGPAIINEILSFSHTQTHPRVLRFLLQYMSSQRLRTPSGIFLLENIFPDYNRNEILWEMQRLRNMFCAIWAECVWAIVSAERSSTKFILSDQPVTFYNSHANPNSVAHRARPQVDLRYVGTHTIFPLSPEKCIIMTPVSWVRNPFQNPTNYRPNPKYLRDTFLDIRQVQVGRKLTEDEVIKFNYVIKRSAQRYIAAENKAWLHPERLFGSHSWEGFESSDLFKPDPRPCGFQAEVIVGGDRGFVDGADEYGRRPNEPGYSDKRQRAIEFQTFQKAKAEFAIKHGPQRRGRNFDFDSLSREYDLPEEHQRYLNYSKSITSSD